MSLLEKAIQQAQQVDAIYYSVYTRLMSARGDLALGFPGSLGLANLTAVRDHIRDRLQQISWMTEELVSLQETPDSPEDLLLFDDIQSLVKECNKSVKQTT